jgi:hypothetical protein
MARRQTRRLRNQPEDPRGLVPPPSIADMLAREEGLREQDLEYTWKHVPPREWPLEALDELLRRLDRATRPGGSYWGDGKRQSFDGPPDDG